MPRALLALFIFGCADQYATPPVAGDAGMPGTDGSSMTDAGSDDAAPPAGPCEVTFRFAPQKAVSQVEARGEWNNFASPGVVLTANAQGIFEGKLPLMPGVVGYKLVIDGDWQLDPAARERKYVGGVENSAVRVADCHVPSLLLGTHGVNGGRFTAQVKLQSAVEGGALMSATATLRRGSQSSPLAGVSVAGSQIAIDAPGLAEGKYTVIVEAKDDAGRTARPLRLVFWVEPRPFEWRDALLYMVMTDRFRNGEPGNDAPRTAGVDARADFMGGDLQGVRAVIADGTFDKLGVTALWLSPFPKNPSGPWLADDGVHQVMGYHGYWPVAAREVEPRIGGEAALKALVDEAHAHGIRVLADFVVNHVHQDHEYVKQHPAWFRTGCVCGTNNCDWTARRLDCLFAGYMPDVDWSNPEVSEQFTADAVWWLETFDLDGLRVDAVKHVEDLAAINLRARISDALEATGLRVFLTGETAMGWSDCGVACNASEYGTISRYIGGGALDGQADFVLHHAVPYRVFAHDQKGMIHVDYWTQQSLAQYPTQAIMTPYIGSHDTPRFATLSTYRGQDASHPMGRPGNKWNDIASAPDSAEPYARHRLALSWLLALPGAPLLYYGDEYGEWGGADPNNRPMWRGGGTLNAEEQATLAKVRALGSARRELAALRRGGYQSLHASEDVLVFARQAGSDVAIVALSRAAGATTSQVTIPASVAADGTVLRDRLGGADVIVQGGRASITLGARGTALFAP